MLFISSQGKFNSTNVFYAYLLEGNSSMNMSIKLCLSRLLILLVNKYFLQSSVNNVNKNFISPFKNTIDKCCTPCNHLRFRIFICNFWERASACKFISFLVLAVLQEGAVCRLTVRLNGYVCERNLLKFQQSIHPLIQSTTSSPNVFNSLKPCRNLGSQRYLYIYNYPFRFVF